jgi:phosphoribosyl-AMP cyclohydrolase
MSDFLQISQTEAEKLADAIKYDDSGLVPAIAQDAQTGQNLMLAYMNHEAVVQTLLTGTAVYWSRSRQKLWCKGETSGHTQNIKSISLDCDADCILMQVEQIGGIACHTGRAHCYFRIATVADGQAQWQEQGEILKSNEEIYGKSSQ